MDPLPFDRRDSVPEFVATDIVPLLVIDPSAVTRLTLAPLVDEEAIIPALAIAPEPVVARTRSPAPVLSSLAPTSTLSPSPAEGTRRKAAVPVLVTEPAMSIPVVARDAGSVLSVTAPLLVTIAVAGTAKPVPEDEPDEPMTVNV